MSTDSRRRLVRRLDSVFFIGLLITSGLAALLFWTHFYDSEETEAVAELPIPTLTATSTITATATDTATSTPTSTMTASVTNTATSTPTSTLTDTSTATDTPTDMPSQTSTHTHTPTFTPTPWPAPIVVPLALARTYAGEPITITGMAQPGDTIQVFDQSEVIGSSVADETGEWEVAFPDGLSPGQHTLSVVAVGSLGATSQPVPVGFEVANAPTAAPTNTPTRTQTPTPTPTHTSLPPTLTFTSIPSDTSVPPTVTPSFTAPVIEPSATTPQTPSPLPPTLTFTAIPSDTLVPLTVTPSMTLTPSPLPPSKTPIPPTPTWTLTPSLTPLPTDTPMLDTQTMTAVAVFVPSSTATTTVPPVPLVSPTFSLIIQSPASGEIYSPGIIPLHGAAPPGVTLEVRNQNTGTVLAAVQVPADGLWQVNVELHNAGLISLIAVVPLPDGEPLISDAVTITIAPPVQPNTGRGTDSDEAGRTFTALLALLLSAGGFSAYFAGRLVYLLAHDRMKTG